jgi:hypothetical protein
MIPSAAEDDAANLLDAPKATGLWALQENMRARRSPRRYRAFFALGLVVAALFLWRAL